MLSISHERMQSLARPVSYTQDFMQIFTAYPFTGTGLGIIFATLFGLLFGSFLNVVLTRLPEGESIVHPGSHCRSCAHVLSWWENIPILSWILLRGRCRGCRARIGIRYPLAELAIGILWATAWWRFALSGIATAVICAFFFWILAALAALDAEYFWLPDVITLPGAILGILLHGIDSKPWQAMAHALYSGLLMGFIILLIRWTYWLVRRREGMGLGDAKLMALLGAWIGWRLALDALFLAVLLATVTALAWLIVQAISGKSKGRGWTQMPLPFGTFLCLGAVIVKLHDAPLLISF